MIKNFNFENRLGKNTVDIFIKEIILIISLIFVLIPMKTIWLDLYSWHIQQPQYIQGGIEIISLYLIMFCCVAFLDNKKTKTGMIIILSFGYLRLHQALIPLLTAIVYFEMIISIGYSTRYLLKIKFENNGVSYIYDFLIGTIIWGVFAIFFSLFRLGTFNYLRILTVILFLISIFLSRRKPFTIRLIKEFNNIDNRDKLMVLFLIILVLIQCGKSNFALDYDSLWYGLRPEQVLIGKYSFYDNLGMLQWVNYFPKFVELFFAPLSDLGEYSFIYSANIVVFILYMCLSVFFLKYLNIKNSQSLFYTIILCSIPTISNIATTAKSDFLTTFFIMFAAFNFFKMIKEENRDFFILGLSSLSLCLGGKIVGYLYGFVVFLSGLFLIIFYNYKKDSKNNKTNIKLIFKESKSYYFLLLLSIIVLLGVTYRTYRLTGYPLYPFMVNFFKKIGFSGVYPFNEYFGGRKPGYKFDVVFNLKFYLKHIYNLIFDPKKINVYRASHIAIGWYGNFGIFLFFVTSFFFSMKLKNNVKLFFKKDFKTIAAICLPVIFTMLFIAIFKFHYGQDGNYYMVPLSLGTIFFIYIFENINIKICMKHFCYIIFILFIVSQSLIMFASHTSWRWGTSKFDLDFTKPIFESKQRKEYVFRSNGLTELEEYIEEKNYSNSRAIGFGYNQKMFELSCGYEDIPNSSYMTKGIFDTKENFKKYIRWANINYIIIPKSDSGISGYEGGVQGYEPVMEVFHELEKEDDIIKIESEKYYMLDITQYTNKL